MGEWIDDLATALGEEPLTEAEAAELLDVAREVAHGVERKVTPLSTFLLGVAVGRGGEGRPAALAAALARLRAALGSRETPR